MVRIPGPFDSQPSQQPVDPLAPPDHFHLDMMTRAAHDVTPHKYSAFGPQLVVAASDTKNPGQANYRCDGADDQITVKEAFDALPDSGGTVLLMPGTYLFSDQVVVTATNDVRLAGLDWGAVIKATAGFPTGGGFQMVSIGGDRNQVSNFTIDGSGVAETGVSISGLEPRFTNIKVLGCTSIGLSVSAHTGGSGGYVTGCVVEGGGVLQKGIGASGDCIIIGNAVQECTVAHITGRNIIANNRIRGAITGTGVGTGIRDDGGGDQLYIGNYILQCRIGIESNTSSANPKSFVGNFIDSGGREGIRVSQFGGDLLIANNRIHDCSIEASNTYDAIFVDTAYGGLVQGNHITSNRHRHGIRLGANTAQMFVTGNYIPDETSTNYISNVGTNNVLHGNFHSGGMTH